MGTTKISTANFRGGMKKFGKSVINAGKNAVLFIGAVMLLIVMVVAWVIFNMITLLTAPVWMLVAFICKPLWFAKRLNQPVKDELEEFLTDYLIGASNVFGGFFIWLGTRSWMIASIRNPFIQECDGLSLQSYPVKVQMSYWNWCSYKSNNFRFGLSDEGRKAVIASLLCSGNFEAIKDIANDCRADKFLLLNALVDAMRKNPIASSKVIEVLNSFYYTEWRYNKLSESDIAYLINFQNRNLTCSVILATGMDVKRAFGLINQGEFGIKIISEYAKSKTFSNDVIALLIKKSLNSKEIKAIMTKVIIKNGLDAKLLSDFYVTNDSEELREWINECLTAFADRTMLKGTSDDEEENSIRWECYCKQQNSIHPEAQVEMNLDDYETFKRYGHNLHPEALRYLIISIGDKKFFKCLITREWKNIVKNSELVRLIKATPWKHAMYVDVCSGK